MLGKKELGGLIENYVLVALDANVTRTIYTR